MAKERIDTLLVQRKLVDSREKAKRMIMAGLVFSDTERIDKPGMKVDVNIPLHVKETLKYVSRGGYKLEKALETFATTIKNKIVVDIGSSTGGFTDCALQNGASHVYAIDVGTNQLVWKLRNDSRVTVHEKTNFRYINKELFTNNLPNFAVIDVSFISLRLILPVLKTILQNNSHVITLIKPQFEAKKEQVGKKGIIRDTKTHEEVLNNFIAFANGENFEIQDIIHSPITGTSGNIEFLCHLTYSLDNGVNEHKLISTREVSKIVTKAHEQLK